MQFTAKMQKALCHFAAYRNKTKAYRHAYDTDNMSDATIRHEAWLIFEHPIMAQAVAQMDAVAAATVKIDAAWVLERLARLADFNINKFIEHDADTGKAVYNFTEATDRDWYCISEYSTKMITKADGDLHNVEDVKLKAHCKLKALALCGKHTNVGAFVDRLEVSGTLGIAQLNTDEYKQARKEMLGGDDC